MTGRRARARCFAAVTAAAFVTSGLAVVAAGTAAADTTFRVPANDRLQLRGRGYGHGNGMSQYGAQGAAMQGRSYRQILAFYYPGTKMSRAGGKVRVLVSADSSPDVVVSPRPGLAVRSLSGKATTVLPQRAGATRWRIAPRARGRSTVQFRASGSWHRWRRLAGEAEFLANGRPIQLWVPSGGQLVSRTYRGRLRLASPSPGATTRDTVNVVRMNHYLRGVVPSEMPASWHPQALRAQAVAARTYAVWLRAQNRSRYYQLCDTTTCQVYGGVASEQPATNAAVAGTGRAILRYQGAPALTQFSSSSGGWTASGGTPYLRARPDPFDGWRGNPYHRWRQRIAASAITSAYPALGRLKAVRIVARTGDGRLGGRVEQLVLVGRRSTAKLSGDDFRWQFGLRSTWFTIAARRGARSPSWHLESARELKRAVVRFR